MLSSSFPDVEIRLAQMSDLPELLRLENACFSGDRISRRSFRRFLESAGASCLVAEANGQMLGYALLLFRSGTAMARLYSFAVDPAARGSGLSRRLLAAAEADAFERERILLRLEVREDNAPARALYERPAIGATGGLRITMRTARPRSAWKSCCTTRRPRLPPCPISRRRPISPAAPPA
jgi:ribosomal protein S18 acetylase RimI-like enzyme